MARFALLLMITCSVFAIVPSPTFAESIPAGPTAEVRASAGSVVEPVDRAVGSLREFLVQHPDRIDALLTLARVHLIACEMGRTGVVTNRPSGDEIPLALQDQDIPFNRHSKRQVLLPANRLRHLADAVSLLRRAHELEPGNTDISVRLGWALTNCRDRFRNSEWPLTGNAFDDRARQERSAPAFWDAEAFPVLRVVTETLGEYEARLYVDGTSTPGTFAAALLTQLLGDGRSLTDDEQRELSYLTPFADSWRQANYREIPMGGTPLPPQPWELNSIYPATAAGLAAAELYFQALDASVAHADIFANLPIIGAENVPYKGQPLTTQQQDLIKKCIDANKESYRLIHQGALARECRYPINLSLGPELRLPHFAAVLDLARLCTLKALYEADTANGDAAAEVLIDALGIANSIRYEPLLLSQLVRIKIMDIVTKSLEDVLQRTDISVAAAKRLHHALEVDTPQVFWNIALAGEAVYVTIAVRANPDTATKAFDIAPFFERCKTAAQQPYKEAYDEILTLSEAASVPMPAIVRTLTAAYRGVAGARTAQVALASDRYWIDHGVLPDSVEALVPAYLPHMVLDPFDDAPMRIRMYTQGIVIYSVGDNLADDGGTEGDGHPRLDTTFTVGVVEAKPE